ncbi:MAG: helix-turn-helix domain-containing protein [Verrucomicrobiales bacterium]
MYERSSEMYGGGAFGLESEAPASVGAPEQSSNGWEVVYRQLGRGILRNEVSSVSCGPTTITQSRTNLACHLTGRSPANAVSLILPLQILGTCRIWGKEIDENHLVLPGLDQEMDVVIFGVAEVAAITVAHDHFAEVATIFGLDEQVVPAAGTRLFRMNRTQVERLRELFVVARSENVGLDDGAVGEIILKEACAVMAADTCEGHCSAGNATSRMLSVKLAAEFMEEHLDQPLRLEEVSEVVGVGVRSLQRSFQEIMGMSPMSYLKALRLNGVRSQLWQAGTEKCLVTKTAQRYGFTHFGHFGHYYKNMFDETPSQTLRERRAG